MMLSRSISFTYKSNCNNAHLSFESSSVGKILFSFKNKDPQALFLYLINYKYSFSPLTFDCTIFLSNHLYFMLMYYVYFLPLFMSVYLLQVSTTWSWHRVILEVKHTGYASLIVNIIDRMLIQPWRICLCSVLRYQLIELMLIKLE